MKQKTGKDPETKVFKSEARKISEYLSEGSVDTICAEPFLGQPLKGNESEKFLKDQAKELKQMYLESFRELKKILKSDGCIIFIIPIFKFKNQWINIDCQSELEKIGLITEPLLELPQKTYKQLLYYRPGQKVGREIWKFKKVLH